MKLTKAIEILRSELCVPNSVFLQDKYQAILLGMRAMERIQSYRRDKCHTANMPLKGET